MKQILIVEDDRDIVSVLELYLRGGGFRTERAKDGEEAVTLFDRLAPDLVLLDITLPKRDGLDVLRHIRARSVTPVIVLTARTEEIDQLLGLELGADDYVTKPFRPRTLLARIKAVLRRSQGGGEKQGQQVVRVGSVTLDALKHHASVDGDALALTATEFGLLRHLMFHPGRVFTRGELLEAVLPESEALERVIDTHLRNLRRKLADASAGHLIETVRGAGYRLIEREPA